MTGTFKLGSLVSGPASLRPDLWRGRRGAPVPGRLAGRVGVVEIDPAVSGTTATQQEFGVESEALANCVVVGGKREGTERVAACVVLACPG